MGKNVGFADGDSDGLVLGDVDGEALGDPLGLVDGDVLGLEDGLTEGDVDGLPDGEALGDVLGDRDGLVEGLVDGYRVGVVGEVVAAVRPIDIDFQALSVSMLDMGTVLVVVKSHSTEYALMVFAPGVATSPLKDGDCSGTAGGCCPAA